MELAALAVFILFSKVDTFNIVNNFDRLYYTNSAEICRYYC